MKGEYIMTIKSYLSRTLSYLLAALVLCGGVLLAIPVSAAEELSGNRYCSAFPPETFDTVTLKTADWNGKSALKANTCYFVEKTATVTKSVSLPESSMIVVKNGANLRIASGKKLLINGVLAVHTGAKINPMKGGSVIFKSKSVSVINGTLAVSKGGYAGIYGYVQCGGAVNVKGSLSILNNGSLVCGKAVKEYSTAKISGAPAIADKESRPLYMIQELEPAQRLDISLFSESNGNSAVISAVSDKREVIRSFESVLYQYSGEIELPIAADEFMMDIGYLYEGKTVGAQRDTDNVSFGITRWNGIPMIVSNNWEDELTGCYYSAVRGKPDTSVLERFVPDGE